MLCGPKYFVVHGRQRCAREAVTQAAVGADRCLVGRDREQDRDSDRTAARFLDKIDLVGDGKKRFKQLVTKIDDFCYVLVRDQVVEQRHLAVDLANRGRCGFFRQKLRQRPLTGIEIEGRDQAAFTEMKVGEQSRQQCFADAWPRRCNNGDGAAECHRLTGRRCSIGVLGFLGSASQLPGGRCFRSLARQDRQASRGRTHPRRCRANGGHSRAERTNCWPLRPSRPCCR